METLMGLQIGLWGEVTNIQDRGWNKLFQAWRCGITGNISQNSVPAFSWNPLFSDIKILDLLQEILWKLKKCSNILRLAFSNKIDPWHFICHYCKHLLYKLIVLRCGSITSTFPCQLVSWLDWQYQGGID